MLAIASQEIEAAKQARDEAWQAWRKAQTAWANSGGPPINEEVLANYQTWVTLYQQRISETAIIVRRLYRQKWLLGLLTGVQGCVTMIQKVCGIESPHAWAASVIMAAFLTAPITIFTIFIHLRPNAIALIFVFGLLAFSVILTSLTYPAFVRRTLYRKVRNGVAISAMEAQLRRGQEQVAQSAGALAQATHLWEHWIAYRQAAQHWATLLATVNGERYQLLHRDWRKLRGIPFEKFLAQIFSVLGYTVEITKSSGDDGVDLVVTGPGRRIAVQAKGYEGRVGKSPVQEVYTGMRTYQCTECVAVTNSTFTRGAIRLAKTVNCRLIHGARIPDLIMGRIPEFPDLVHAPLTT